MYFAELDWTLGTARGAQSYQILGLREKKKKKTEWTVLNDSWGPFTSETPTNVSLSYIPVMRKEILENSVPREKKKKVQKKAFASMPKTANHGSPREGWFPIPMGPSDHTNQEDKGFCFLEIILFHSFAGLLIHSAIQWG